MIKRGTKVDISLTQYDLEKFKLDEERFKFFCYLIEKIDEAVIFDYKDDLDSTHLITKQLTRNIRNFKDIKYSQSEENMKKERYFFKMSTDSDAVKLDELNYLKSYEKDIIQKLNRLEEKTYNKIDVKDLGRKKNMMVRQRLLDSIREIK